MASAAEQLASSINFGAFSKATELKKRIWFTLGALIIYRLGTYIPLPGIDPHALEALFQQQAGGILGMFDMFSGGALRRMTDLRPQHHALHLGLDHHAADDEHLADPRSPQEGGRERAARRSTSIRAC